MSFSGWEAVLFNTVSLAVLRWLIKQRILFFYNHLSHFSSPEIENSHNLLYKFYIVKRFAILIKSP